MDESLEEEELYEQSIAITPQQDTSKKFISIFIFILIYFHFVPNHLMVGFVIGVSKRNVRGVTKGLSVQKKIQSTQKLDVIIHPIRNRIVGENAKDFKTEACVVVKNYAGVQHPRWRDIPMDNKRKMWAAMKVYVKLWYFTISFQIIIVYKFII